MTRFKVFAKDKGLAKYLGIDLEQDGEFFTAIGIALTEWQYVEKDLYLIFALLIDSPHEKALAAAFHSALNLNIRLDMVDAAAQFRLEGTPLLAEWDSIRDKVDTRARLRNKIAHYTVSYNRKARSKHKRIYMEPSHYDVTSHKKMNKQQKTACDLRFLRGLETSFNELSHEMYNFIRKLVAAGVQP